MPERRPVLFVDLEGGAPGPPPLPARSGLAVHAVADLDEARAALEDGAFQALLVAMDKVEDLQPEAIAALRREHPGTPVVLLTRVASLRGALGALRAGAFDCLPMPYTDADLAAVLERAFAFASLSRAIEQAEAPGELPELVGGIVGESPALRQVFALVRKVANSRSAVLITGESGTGKEVVARSIHFLGPRAGARFEAINMVAIPEGLIEAELFGHLKGAFTGADRPRRGLFELASGGTLFLDEVGDMGPVLQAKLLRVLQERAVRPVGSEHSVEVDTRIISATHRNLEEEVAAGRFREDLYFRLNVIPIHIPPLREHSEDVAPLARAFVRKHADRPGRRLSEAALERLACHPWRGNVRELENAIERALALSEGDEIQETDLSFLSAPEHPRAVVADSLLPAAVQQQVPLREVQRRYIEEILRLTGGNRIDAARILGIDRRTLYRRATKPHPR